MLNRAPLNSTSGLEIFPEHWLSCDYYARYVPPLLNLKFLSE